MSWHNPLHPGYAYPEISGLLLSLLAQYDHPGSEVRVSIAIGLIRDLGAADAVGRTGIDYVFDSAMVLAGLLDHADAGGGLNAPLVDRLFVFITDTLRERRGIRGAALGDPLHWSNSYGAHLLKTAIAITAYLERMPEEEQVAGNALIVQLMDDLLPSYEQGRFRLNASSTRSYLHAHCYATEGLICISRRGLANLDREILGSAQWLAKIQDSSGGIMAWHDGSVPSGSLRTDATAQAIRVWCLVDHQGFTPNILNGLRYLSDVRTASGGLRYEPGSDDVNAWATIFGYQAMEWADSGRKDNWWLV